MASFFSSTIAEFLSLSEAEILSRLTLGYANSGYTRQFTDQTLTWEHDLRQLRITFQQCAKKTASALEWGILLEFSIPRKEKRIDAILLVGGVIVVLEIKAIDYSIEARRQVEEYALLLHYFHKESSNKRIIPILVSPRVGQSQLGQLRQMEFFPQLPTYWIASLVQANWDTLCHIIAEIALRNTGTINVEEWDTSPYFPVPSIIEAALSLRSGLSIREIAHSEASEHEIERVRETIQLIVDEAQERQQHAICFLTGVPGSGKTLVGLSLAHSEKNQRNAIHFMSGNGPLVKVLQHLFTQEARRKGASAVNARTEAKTLLENVHVFARYYMETNQYAPSNHAIIFDEAQRAWNREQNLRKFKRDYSEPEMLLSIMERHSTWSVIVALVGGGQEINNGESGLEEWGRALATRPTEWRVYASPEVISGGPSTAGHRLFESNGQTTNVETCNHLHLRTSNRSLRAENLAKWVNHVLEGDAESARTLNVSERFPIFITRSLKQMRKALNHFAIGNARFGLVGSSKAERLRAEGLEPNSAFHGDYPWEHWYLAGRTDVRSSFQCEVFATEFEIQGLELDWIGLCWGGDMVWDQVKGWQLRTFWPGPPGRWSQIKKQEKRTYRINSYRVLLTRARQGMVLFIPNGSDDDPTIDREEFNATFGFLVGCGVSLLPD